MLEALLSNNKREELVFLLEKHNIDILAITETWAHEGVEDPELHFSGYTMFRRDREKTRGGGSSFIAKMSWER